MRTHRFRTIAAGACASALLTLAACGGGDDEAGGDTTTTDPTAAPTDAPSTTLDPAAQAKADVRAAYDAYWAMFERLASDPQPDDPEIDQRVAGSARDKLVDSLTTMQAQGQRFEFGPSNGHRVVDVAVEGGTATVTDCVIDEGVRVGRHPEDRKEFPATSGLLVATLQSQGGAWLLTTISKPPAAEVGPTCGS